MSLMNRMLGVLLAAIWLALGVGLLVLIWGDNPTASFDSANLAGSFSVFTTTTAEQILATIIVGALMAPAALLVMAELVLHPRSADAVAATDYRKRNGELESRVAYLQKELDSERRRNGEAVVQSQRDESKRADAATDDAADQRERAVKAEAQADRERDRTPTHHRWGFFGR